MSYRRDCQGTSWYTWPQHYRIMTRAEPVRMAGFRKTTGREESPLSSLSRFMEVEVAGVVRNST